MTMNSPQEATTVSIPLFEGLVSEIEYARQRGVSLRTCQRDRQLRQSPPFVTIGKKVYYRIESIRKWVIAQEHHLDRSVQSLSRGGRR